MALPCTICNGSFGSKPPGLSCCGACKKPFHFFCADIAPELSEFFKTTKGLLWKSPGCNHTTTANNVLNAVEEFITFNFNKFIIEVKKELDLKCKTMKGEFLQSSSLYLGLHTVNGSGHTDQTACYDQVASVSSKSKILIKPKDSKQDAAATKSAIMSKVDHIILNVNFNINLQHKLHCS